MGIWGKVLPFVAAMIALGPVAWAADGAWPTRAVRIMVPLPAGGAVDVAARLYGEGLSRRWRQPVVIENRPGAETNIGTGEFARVRDDHTLLFTGTFTLTVNPLVFDTVPFDPERDLVPISSGTNVITVVAVHDNVAARSLGDLVRLAKAEPGRLLWAGPALPRYTFAAFLKRHGLDMRHLSYRDIATPQVDLSEGRLQVLVHALQVANAPVESGKARIIAVTNTDRAPMLPDVPTAAEAGYPELTVDGLAGFFGWREIPAALRERIAADVQAVAREPETRNRLKAAAQHASAAHPAEFAAAIERQRVRMAEIARLIGLKSAR